MSHTPDQQTLVLKILSYKPHQYYEILQVTKSSSESDIKKSYRKLAIKLHPDKNPHPKADEAFKIVNKAWGVLSDPQKKRIFDATGSDPDARFNPSMSSNTARTSGMNSRFGTEEVFNDDIFEFFFGNQGARGFGAAGGGPQTFTFGSNGFTFQSFGGAGGPGFGSARPRQRQRASTQPEDTNIYTTLKQLLPIIFFVLISIIPSFFSESSIPDYSFNKTSKFNYERSTPNLKIPFFVNEKFMNKKNYTNQQLKNFDSKVENLFIQDKRAKCSKEQVIKNELIDEAHGWFSTDQEKLKRAQNYPMPNCQVLRHYNLI
ncbi:protein Hlj1p [[Candida] jaroonii]|uniref:Protein Hlj1p n=1 Tax=[Candida] jaroonii TaxID=467808 RepID=A0ACA9Y339_9ASCO|nr:protein Hlj1p [[Candida] jaroonii]